MKEARWDIEDEDVNQDDYYGDDDYRGDYDDDDEDGEGNYLTTDSWIGGACNGHNITGLSAYDYYDNAESAMKCFFEKEVLKPHNKWAASSAKGEKYSQPAAHYVFAQGPATYGTKFAAYIEEHKLGKLATVGKVNNLKYHPGSKCQVWVWAPDMDALVEWWETIIKKERAPKGKVDIKADLAPKKAKKAKLVV